MILLEIKDATFIRQGEEVFKNFSWKIEHGQHWVIVGPVASGKTSLMQALSGQLRLAEGSATYFFLPPDIARWQLQHHILHVVFANRLVSGHDHYYQQRYNLSSKEDHTLTVRQYVSYVDYEVAPYSTLKISELLDTELIMLSNGQTRRVLLAKALHSKPALLLLDNPFAGLDTESRIALRNFINQLIADGQRIILTCTHQEDIPESFTHALLLQKREVIFSGKRSKLPQPILKEANSVSQLALQQISSFDVAVQLKNVSVSYNQKIILQHINWTIRKGEKWALLGPNGSGKSTLLSLINADNPQAYANDIILFDQPKYQTSIWHIKKRIGYYSPELQAYFHESLTAEDVLLTGYSDTFVVPKHITQNQKLQAYNLMSWYKKQDLLTRFYFQLSSGEQRLVLFLRALIKESELLILDEPFQGFDEQLIAQSRQLIDIVSQHKSLIFVTHYPNEIPASVNKQLRLKNGIAQSS